MNFIAGKYYKTRGGNRAIVNIKTYNQLVGAWESHDKWHACTWNIDGSYLQNIKRPLDLVDEMD